MIIIKHLAHKPSAPRLNLYRAHALMFPGRDEEAKPLYLLYADEKAGEGLLAGN
jgi:hypothetical protein